MKKPKVELKKVKTFHGNEGLGLNAEVWVDGINTAYVIDDASGSIFYDFNVVHKPNWEKLLKYVESLPDEPLVINGDPFMKDGAQVMIKPTIEQLIDDAHKELETAKNLKRLSRKFSNAIVWGQEKFNGKYTYVTFKKPLAEIDTATLQGFVDKYKKDLKPGEIFYNNNFESLHIKI